MWERDVTGSMEVLQTSRAGSNPAASTKSISRGMSGCTARSHKPGRVGSIPTPATTNLYFVLGTLCFAVLGFWTLVFEIVDLCKELIFCKELNQSKARDSIATSLPRTRKIKDQKSKTKDQRPKTKDLKA